MPNDNLQANRNASRICNEYVLTDAGFSKVGSSSLYKKDGTLFILSPGIGKGMHEKYWFDIRMANLNTITKVPDANAWVLLRIVPDWFAFFSISRIREHMKQDTQENRAHSGKVWGFYCDLDEGDRRITISAKSEKSASFSTELLDCTRAASALAEVRI